LESLLPFLASGDGVAINGSIKSPKPERDIELVSEITIVTAVGYEGTEFAVLERKRRCGLTSWVRCIIYFVHWLTDLI
jgi:hypothetical protein